MMELRMSYKSNEVNSFLFRVDKSLNSAFLVYWRRERNEFY